MKQHTVLGDQVLQSVEDAFQQPVKDGDLGYYSRLFLRIAREVVLSHQERWVGTGYP